MSGKLSEVPAPAAKWSLYCSFCGRAQEDVLALVAGPSVFICNICIDAAAAVCADMTMKKMVDADLYGAEQNSATGSATTAEPGQSPEPRKDATS